MSTSDIIIINPVLKAPDLRSSLNDGFESKSCGIKDQVKLQKTFDHDRGQTMTILKLKQNHVCMSLKLDMGRSYKWSACQIIKHNLGYAG